MAPELLSAQQEQELHRRLLARDAAAPADLAKAYIVALLTWLREKNSKKLDDELLEDAVTETWENLCRNPASYRGEQSLWSYLKMSAQGDLKNRLKAKARRTRPLVPYDSVAHEATAGILERSEEDGPDDQAVLAAIRARSNEEERIVLELLCAGERSTAVYARTLRIEHLPLDQQRAQVNRLKERLKKRLRRYGETRDDTPGTSGAAD